MQKCINEMFTSVQGEGQLIGLPSIFIRFSTCNLNCSWCDTAYIRNENPKKNICDAIYYINTSNVKNIVFTGGEPLLYQDEMCNILDHINNIESITIETNGTIEPSMILIEKMSDINNKWAVSPKIYMIKSWNKNTLIFFDSLNNVFFKFVISYKKEIDMIDSLVLKNEKILQINSHKLTTEDYINRYDEIIKYMIHKGYNYRLLPQLQYIFYINQRGT